MPEPSNHRVARDASGLAAIAVLTCCLGPLVLAALSSTGAWISDLEVRGSYRSIVIGAAFGATLVALLVALRHILRPAHGCKPHVGERTAQRSLETRPTETQP